MYVRSAPDFILYESSSNSSAEITNKLQKPLFIAWRSLRQNIVFLPMRAIIVVWESYSEKKGRQTLNLKIVNLDT